MRNSLPPELLSLHAIEAARELLTGVVHTTPLVPSRPLSDAAGTPAWLKCEHQQRAGSYKVRGAYTRIARLTDAERARGVVAARAGNHAQGVALAARRLGCCATVVMPTPAPGPGCGVAPRPGSGRRRRRCPRSRPPAPMGRRSGWGASRWWSRWWPRPST